MCWTKQQLLETFSCRYCHLQICNTQSCSLKNKKEVQYFSSNLFEFFLSTLRADYVFIFVQEYKKFQRVHKLSGTGMNLNVVSCHKLNVLCVLSCFSIHHDYKEG